jgi:hypothetical protein
MGWRDFHGGAWAVKLEPAGLTTKEDDMELIVSNLVSRFGKGLLSRRELVRGLTMLAAGGTAASAQEGLNFKAATIDHVSIQVADLKRSSEFYQKMFGFKEVSGTKYPPARQYRHAGLVQSRKAHGGPFCDRHPAL